MLASLAVAKADKERSNPAVERTPASVPSGSDRVFVKDGFRSYRRTYRVGEVYWGLGTGAVLLGLIAWVKWKGDHPDPALFDMSAALRAGPGDAPGNAASGGPSSPGPSSRGPLPADLASGAFQEGKLGAYSSEDMYVKINGRASYFQSFGVKSLHTVTLEAKPESGLAGASIDIEVYDMGESRNALGAHDGERPPSVTSTSLDGSTFYVERNAGFLARGAHYARFIGSDESPAVVAEVRRLVDVFRRALPGEALPWGFSLFVDQLKLDPSSVTYVRNNAFSFGFGRDVFKASVPVGPGKDDVQPFVVATADASAAAALAERYAQGFGSLGSPEGKTDQGVAMFKDEFLGTYSAATSSERWVVGVYGAPDAASVSSMLQRVIEGLKALPEDVRARAVPSAIESGEPGYDDPGASPPAAAPNSEGAERGSRGGGEDEY